MSDGTPSSSQLEEVQRMVFSPLPTFLTADSVPIKERLRALHTDELAELSQTKSARQLIESGWFVRVFLDSIVRYTEFMWFTWWGVIKAAVTFSMGPIDFASVLFFAVVCSVVITLGLFWCLFANLPICVAIYKRFAGRWGGDLSLINSSYPNLFKCLTQEQAEVAKEALSGSPSGSTAQNEREFNLDIARLTLQLASLMYERSTEPLHDAIAATREKPAQPSSSNERTPLVTLPVINGQIKLPAIQPGKVLRDLLGSERAQQISSILNGSKQDNAIRTFCKQFGIEYEPVSELNDVSSAYTALFWDPNSNWIVLAFKGTGPTEFQEWVTDFTISTTWGGGYLRGFQRVHKGFLDRLFPLDTPHGKSHPWVSIALAIKTLSRHLSLRNNNGEPVNVWTTGHSLGCSIAAVGYSRALTMASDFGRHAQLRDAYLFAAPVVCDAASAQVFNREMHADEDCPKTMWRITCHGDAVATLLPELGDRPNFNLSSKNVFAYAHLGQEIKMRDGPQASKVIGTHLPRGTCVKVISTFSNVELTAMRRASVRSGLSLPWFTRRLVFLPLIGRMVAHFPGQYWDQLERMSADQCVWADN